MAAVADWRGVQPFQQSKPDGVQRRLDKRRFWATDEPNHTDFRFGRTARFSAGNEDRFLRQRNLFAKCVNSRIATKQREFREVEGTAYSRATEFSDSVQCLQSAILVAQTGINDCLVKRIRFQSGCEFLSVLATTGPTVGITEITLTQGVTHCGEDLDCFIHSSLAQPGSAQTLRATGTMRG